MGGRLLHASALAGAPRGRRIGGEPGGDQRTVAGDERLTTGGGEGAQSGGARLFDGGLHRPQQRLERGRPALLVLLLQEGQLAQMVDGAQRVAAVRGAPVGLPAVVHAHPREVWQDAHGVGRLAPTLGVDGVVRQAAGAGHVRPGQPAAAAHPGLTARAAPALAPAPP